MSKTTEELLQELIDQNKSNSGNRGSGITGSTPAAASSSSNSSGIMDKAVEGFSKGVGKVGEGIQDSAKTWQQASQIGVGFNNDAIGLRSSIAGTRLSAEEWGGSIDKAKVGLTGLGGTMSESAKRFNQLSYEFSNTDAADELRKIGYTTKEYNDVLAISLAGKKFADFSDAQSRKQAEQAAAGLAVEMDKVAQLTGVSRREQQDALQEKQKNARVQATIELEIRKGGKDASDAYLNMSTKLKGVGLDKLGDELYTGQALSQKAIAQMNALGPAGNQLREAINATKAARSDEDKARAKQMMDRAQAAVAERQSSTEYLTMVQRGQGEVAEAAGEGMIAARNYNKGIEEMKEQEFKATGKRLSTEEAQAALAAKVNKPIDIATGNDKTSADAQAAKTTGLYVQTTARANDTMKLFDMSLRKANEALVTGKNTGPAIDQALAATRNVKVNPETGERTNSIQRGGILNTTAANSAIDAATKGDFKALGSAIGQGAVDVFKQLKDITTTTSNVTGGVAGDASKNKGVAAHGDGGIIKGPELAVIAEKGPEAVIPLDKMKDVMGSAMKTAGGNIDIAKITKDLSTTISASSASAGAENSATSEMAKRKMELTSAMQNGPKEVAEAAKQQLAQLTAATKPSVTGMSRSIPSEMAQQKAEDEKRKAAKPVTTVAGNAPASTAKPATRHGLDDLYDQLKQLNTTMGEMVSHSSEMVSNVEKQVRATKRLDPNVSLRG